MKQRLLLSTIFILFSTFLFSQDKIRISGNVQDDQKEAVIGATVLVKGTTIGTTTDASGNYSLEVPNDAKTLVISYIGLAPKEFTINTSQGDYVLNVNMKSSDVALDQVVVSASKRKEKVLDAPASVSVLGQDKLERNITATPVDQLKTTAGVDVMRTGLISSNVVVRGFNDIFSTTVLNVVDNRIGSVPSLRVNAYQLVPTTNLDLDRIEVVRGPASALYGPNASSGVIHMITKSPLDQEKKFETTVSMTSGFTVLANTPMPNATGGMSTYRQDNGGNPLSGNIINPEFRHSGKLLDGKLGYKISASYFQGQDYPNYDPREPYDGDSVIFGSARNGQIFTPDTLQKYTHVNGLGETVLDSAHLDIRRFKKDFTIRKYTADARIDIKPIKDILITINGGLASTHNVELTGLGAAQGGGTPGSWIYWYFQTQFKWKHLYIQYFINSSNAGNTYLIPQLSTSARAAYSGADPYQVQLLIDKSSMQVAQAQYAYDPLENLHFVFGADFLFTHPNTEGTINGLFENRDNLNQIGGYIQGDYSPLKWLKIVAAARVDYNSIIKNAAVSPRAALVFKVANNQNIRLTYNRAFDSPSTLDQFLDLSNGLIPNGINVRGIGNPYGWQYKYDDVTGGVQFNTAPWGGTGSWNTFGNNSVNARMFDSLQNYMVKTFAGALGGNILAAQGIVNQIFNGISGPTGTVANATQESVDYANFATTKDLPSSIQNNVSSLFQNLKKINNQYTQTIELGYKGLIAGKLSLEVDGYWTRISNYVSALRSASGAVLLDHNTYLGQQHPDGTIDTSGALYKNLYANGGLLNSLLAPVLDGTPSLQNPSIVKPIAGSVWDELVVLTYQFPLGTITPNDPSLIGSDYILTYKNLGRLDVFGIDFGFQYNALESTRHKVTFGGSLSWVDKDQLVLSSGESIALNAPKVKASVTFDHTLVKSGFGYGLSFRYQMGYYASSAIYEGQVKPAYILDARVSYRPNFYKGLLLSLNVNNVNNYQWSSFPGTPLMGTALFARAQVTF